LTLKGKKRIIRPTKDRISNTRQTVITRVKVKSGTFNNGNISDPVNNIRPRLVQ